MVTITKDGWVRCGRYDREGDAYACARRLQRTGRFETRVREGGDGRLEVWQRKTGTWRTRVYEAVARC